MSKNAKLMWEKPHDRTDVGKLIYSLIRLQFISVNSKSHLARTFINHGKFVLFSTALMVKLTEFVKHDSFVFLSKFSQPVQRFKQISPSRISVMLILHILVWESFSWYYTFSFSSLSVQTTASPHSWLFMLVLNIRKKTSNYLHTTEPKTKSNCQM